MRVNVAQIEEALRKSGGFQSKAADMLGISQPAVSKRISNNKRLQRAVRAIKEQYLDLAEINLLKLIRDGDLGSICFYLKCQGKHRGYVERQEITGRDGTPIKVKFLWADEDGYINGKNDDNGNNTG